MGQSSLRGIREFDLVDIQFGRFTLIVPDCVIVRSLENVAAFDWLSQWRESGDVSTIVSTSLTIAGCAIG